MRKSGIIQTRLLVGVLLLAALLMGSRCGDELKKAAEAAAAPEPTTVEAASSDVGLPGGDYNLDEDHDGVGSWCDNCLEVANRRQQETEANDPLKLGNACDCDFNNDGYCNADDANEFLVDFASGVDSDALGTDMTADGVVDQADFDLFDPLYAEGRPGTRRQTPPDVVTDGAEGTCWDDRINAVFGRDNASDGCSVPADQVIGLVALGFPADGDLNNPTNSKVFKNSGGLFSCPNAAFATFHKPGDICGIDIPIARCGSGRGGVPCAPGYCRSDGTDTCNTDADCSAETACFNGICNPDPPVACGDTADCAGDLGDSYVCESEVFCGDVAHPLACEKHDACGAVCGYRTYACNDQFLNDMIAICNNLEGLERQNCHADCILFANAYYESVSLADGQLFADDGTWLDIDFEDEKDDCACCDVIDPDGDGVPAVCGDGVCEPPVETCRVADCPEDCGACEAGDSCLQDEDCPGLACLPNGTCGKLPAGSNCALASECRSGLCVAKCIARCGDGFCDGDEVCGSASPFACFQDCGACEIGQRCLDGNDCAGDAACLFGTCAPKLPDGSPCESNDDCQTGECELFTCGGVKCLADSDCAGLGAELCVAGLCLPVKLPNNQPCVRNAMCQSNICNAGVCVADGSVPPNGVCTNSDACSSGSCVAGICAASCGDGICSPPQEICGAGSSGLDCNADCGKCSNGLVCNSNSDCKSGNCVLGICVADCNIFGASCSKDGDCCSGNCADSIVGKRCGL